MLSIGNCLLEILHYPTNIDAPNSNNSTNRFVGIALETNQSPEETLLFLKRQTIDCSEILEENVLNKEGKIVNIAKVILLNGYTKDFRIFLVFYPKDININLMNTSTDKNSYYFTECILKTNNKSKIIELFTKLNLNILDNQIITETKQKLILEESSENSEIIKFVIKDSIELNLMDNLEFTENGHVA